MTKEQISFKAAQRGYITALESALMGGCLALSQRGNTWPMFIQRKEAEE